MGIYYKNIRIGKTCMSYNKLENELEETFLRSESCGGSMYKKKVYMNFHVVKKWCRRGYFVIHGLGFEKYATKTINN